VDECKPLIIGQFIIYGQASGILGEDSGIYLPY
jgi:hypothetical protein